MAHKDFDAFVREQRKEPLTFALEGHTFRCIPVLPLDLLDHLVGEAMSDKPGLLTIKPFFLSVVVEEDHEKLKELMAKPADAIGVAIWQSILDWLVEEFTGRPTSPQSSSEDGLRPTGDSSRVASIARS